MKNQSFNSKQKAILIAGLAGDKKAENTKVLEMKKVSNFCDYFVITQGESDRQVKAIADFIAEELTKRGIFVRALEGRQETGWILVDVIDVMVHIFNPQMRKFYDLERLWFDAKTIKLPKI